MALWRVDYAGRRRNDGISIAAERFGSRGVIARDVIDAVGVATDTLSEHISFPEMALQG